MRHSWIVLLAAFALPLLLNGTASALGMRVSPAGALIQDYPPGERHELDLPVTIMNDDDQAHDVNVAAVKPSAVGMKPPTGYSDIPDPGFLTFDHPVVSVPPKGKAIVKMVLAIPAGEGYRNQHWSVVLAVRSQPAKGQMVALALYPRLEIETASAPAERSALWRRATPPLGDLVVTPSTVTLEKLVPGGKRQRVALRVWNNTAKPWQGEVTVIAGAEAAKKEHFGLTGGWSWLPDASWVKPREATFQVKAHDSRELLLDVAAPDAKPTWGGSWEGIVLLKSAEGPAAFARVRLRTIAPKAAP